ncbi:MAG: hypothetical protein WCQ16_12225 [Verrucomicrobiae bacterium]
MRFLFRPVSALALGFILSGCFFDRPLTGGPSAGINTWLLGVWETADDKGHTARVMVTPVRSDRYAVALSLPGKKPHEILRYKFEMWPSRVGRTLFLTLRCLESPGDIPAGAHVFVQPQLLDQNSLRVRGLALDAGPSASSYELRKEIRLKLKELSLYEGAQSLVWNRVGEVVWNKDASDPAFKPLRNPALRQTTDSHGDPILDPEIKKIRNP